MKFLAYHHVENDPNAPHVRGECGVGAGHDFRRDELDGPADRDRDRVGLDSAQVSGQPEIDDLQTFWKNHLNNLI